MIRSIQVGDVILGTEGRVNIVIKLSPSEVWYAEPNSPPIDIRDNYYLYEGGVWKRYQTDRPLMEGYYNAINIDGIPQSTPCKFHQHSIAVGDKVQCSFAMQSVTITKVDEDYVWVNDNRDDCISFYDLNRMYDKV
jgi:hypothetical protein